MYLKELLEQLVSYRTLNKYSQKITMISNFIYLLLTTIRGR